MDVFEAIANRRSIRAYKNEPVPADALDKILEAARIAPSAGNRQEYKFIVVTDEATRKALVPACNNQTFVGDAGAVIVGCATNPERRYHAVDVAIAIDHMTLAAHALGLGTCWIGAFSEEKVKELLGIPAEVKVVALLPVGIPAREGVVRPRKSKEELFVKERWQ
ncbi:MAG TPA: nitroreductase [Firmicutes bacterium]|nr:nitroreductase [Candidatus Fermentithermobacillaceae bacterium]